MGNPVWPQLSRFADVSPTGDSVQGSGHCWLLGKELVLVRGRPGHAAGFRGAWHLGLSVSAWGEAGAPWA